MTTTMPSVAAFYYAKPLVQQYPYRFPFLEGILTDDTAKWIGVFTVERIDLDDDDVPYEIHPLGRAILVATQSLEGPDYDPDLSPLYTLLTDLGEPLEYLQLMYQEAARRAKRWGAEVALQTWADVVHRGKHIGPWLTALQADDLVIEGIAANVDREGDNHWATVTWQRGEVEVWERPEGSICVRRVRPSGEDADGNWCGRMLLGAIIGSLQKHELMCVLAPPKSRGKTA